MNVITVTHVHRVHSYVCVYVCMNKLICVKIPSEGKHCGPTEQLVSPYASFDKRIMSVTKVRPSRHTYIHTHTKAAKMSFLT